MPTIIDALGKSLLTAPYYQKVDLFFSFCLLMPYAVYNGTKSLNKKKKKVINIFFVPPKYWMP